LKPAAASRTGAGWRENERCCWFAHDGAGLRLANDDEVQETVVAAARSVVAVTASSPSRMVANLGFLFGIRG